MLPMQCMGGIYSIKAYIRKEGDRVNGEMLVKKHKGLVTREKQDLEIQCTAW